MTFYCNKVGEIFCKPEINVPIAHEILFEHTLSYEFESSIFNINVCLFVKKHFNLRKSSYVHQSFDRKILNGMTYHLKYCRDKAVNV